MRHEVEVSIINIQTGEFVLFDYLNLVIGHCLVIVSCVLVISYMCR